VSGGDGRVRTDPDGRIHFRLVYEIPAPPERVWPILADTERLNRRVGLPKTQRQALAKEPVNIALMRASLNGLPLTYYEEPFTFVEGQHYWVRRRFVSGPLKEFNGGIRFEAFDRGTIVTAESELVPANVLGKLIIQAICRKTKQEFDRAIAGILEHLRDEGSTAYGEGVDLAVASQREVVLARLASAERSVREHPLAGRLFEYIASQGDVQVHAIRPFALARQWGEERHEVLQLCLRAARAGVLDMSWDLLCPNCRGASEQWTRLDQVKQEAHCDSCQITYDANFDRVVEVTFRPNSAYRHVDVGRFCTGGPMNTPHVVLQWILRPDESVELEPVLTSGRYRLRNLRADLATEIFADGDEEHTALTAEFGESVRLDHGPHVRSGPLCLTLTNRTGERQQVLLERMASYEEAATAAVVTVHQEFRDLFGSEVLSPSVRLGIHTLPLMFTDLRGSTQLYRELGDASAYALVRDHFELLQETIARHGGGVVKTIGDAVMAAFPTPREAMACALDIHRGLAAFNRGRENQVYLKIGLHSGPCIAVRSYDERLDYFGSSVNLAARTHGMSTGADVTVTETMLQDPHVAELVENLDQERFVADLRGIGEVPLVRILVEGSAS
jgi:class 3 adenylate cyclase